MLSSFSVMKPRANFLLDASCSSYLSMAKKYKAHALTFFPPRVSKTEYYLEILSTGLELISVPLHLTYHPASNEANKKYSDGKTNMGIC